METLEQLRSDLQDTQHELATLRDQFETNDKPVPKGKRYYCEETTLDIEHGAFTVRVWLNNDYQREDAQYLYDCVRNSLRQAPDGDRSQLAVYLGMALAPKVTTVQVIEKVAVGVRVGTMIYTEPL